MQSTTDTKSFLNNYIYNSVESSYACVVLTLVGTVESLRRISLKLETVPNLCCQNFYGLINMSIILVREFFCAPFFVEHLLHSVLGYMEDLVIREMDKDRSSVHHKNYICYSRYAYYVVSALSIYYKICQFLIVYNNFFMSPI